MPKAPSAERLRAFEIYKGHDGQIGNREIAKLLSDEFGKEVPERSVGGWKSKSKDNWDFHLERGSKPGDKVLAEDRSTPIKQDDLSEYSDRNGASDRSTPIKSQGPDPPKKRTRQVKQDCRGAPKGNSNAKGNPGGGAPERNQNAVSHGFYRSFLPTRLQRIAEQMEGRDMLDMLREQITVLNSIIFDSLQQLYVDDMDDHREFITKEKAPSGAFLGAETEDGTVVLGEIEREWHTAWDRQSKALQGYDRQVARFQSLVRTYMQLSGEGDFFRLQIEKMEQDIQLDRERFEHQKAMDEARLDLATYKALPPSDEDDEPTESDGYSEAMGGMTAQEVWGDDDTTPES